MTRALKECSSMSMETKHPVPQGGHGAGSGPGAGYEQSDAHIPDLLKFGFWMAVVIAVTLISMKWTFNYMERTQTVSVPAGPFARPRELPPSPRLQVEPHQELTGLLPGAGEGTQQLWLDQPASARRADSH
jgi:hypothetical protein